MELDLRPPTLVVTGAWNPMPTNRTPRQRARTAKITDGILQKYLALRELDLLAAKRRPAHDGLGRVGYATF